MVLSSSKYSYHIYFLIVTIPTSLHFQRLLDLIFIHQALWSYSARTQGKLKLNLALNALYSPSLGLIKNLISVIQAFSKIIIY